MSSAEINSPAPLINAQSNQSKNKKQKLMHFKPKLAQQKLLWSLPLFDSTTTQSPYKLLNNDQCICGYHNQQNILIVGDGDLSFTLSLLKHFHSDGHHNYTIPHECNICSNHAPLIVCSTYENYDELCKRYAKAAENIVNINQYDNVIVLHSIDATLLNTTLYNEIIKHDTPLHRRAMKTVYNQIIFNFPHTGGKMMLGQNRELVQSFLYSIRCNTVDQGKQPIQLICAQHSTVHITLCHGQGGTPSDDAREYGNHWQINSYSSLGGFVLHALYRFDAELYGALGYNSKGYRSADSAFHNHSSLVHVMKVMNDNDTIPCFRGQLNVSNISVDQWADQYVSAVKQYTHAINNNHSNQFIEPLETTAYHNLQTTQNCVPLQYTASTIISYMQSIIPNQINLSNHPITISSVNTFNNANDNFINSARLHKISGDAVLLPHILLNQQVQQYICSNQPFITSPVPVYNQSQQYDLVALTTPHVHNYTFVVNPKHPVVNYLPERLWVRSERYNCIDEMPNNIVQSTTRNQSATNYINTQYPMLHQLLFVTNSTISDYQSIMKTMFQSKFNMNADRITVEPTESISLSFDCNISITITHQLILYHLNQLLFPSQYNSVVIGQIGQISNGSLICILVVEPMAMSMYNITDLRTLHTTDQNIITKWKNNGFNTKNELYSLYHTVYIRDNALYIENTTFNEQLFISIALHIAGDYLIRINLLEVYQHPTRGATRTYRFLYQSNQTSAIAHSHIKLLQQIILQTLSKLKLVTLIGPNT